MINYSSIKISFIYIMLLVGVNNIALAQTQSSPEAPLQQEDFNFRTLNLFKWPSDTLISNEDPESANTLSAKKKIADNNCRKFQTQYSKEAKKSFGLKDANYFSTLWICDYLQANIANTKTFKREDYNFYNRVMVAKADNYLLQYYFNGTAATVKIYNNSIFGLIGIPMRFNLIIIQALLLLSIGLNFLLIYKVFKQ